MRPLLPGSLHSGPENKTVIIAKLITTLLINHAEFMYRYRVNIPPGLSPSHLPGVSP